MYKTRQLTRKKELKKRKNFSMTFSVTIFLWLIFICFAYFVDPDVWAAVPIFLSVLFLNLLFTTSLILANTRRGILISGGIVIFLFLRYLGIGNILNLILLTTICIIVEIYYTRLQ